VTLDTYFALRLDGASVKLLEQIALANGITKSALARNSIKLVLAPKQETGLVDKIIEKTKRERATELFGRKAKE
jgi:hypothetical protein